MINLTSPVKLRGAVMTPVWSGDALSRMYERFRGCGNIGEVWETSADADHPAVALLPDGTSVPFYEYLRKMRLPVPPLVKLIDAGTDLSVQVHPDDISAKKFGGTSKSELWYVLRSDPDSSILYGTESDVTADEVKAGIRSVISDDILCRYEVEVGDTVMIPPGMIHSLGGGITVLEIQDRIGTTYRLRDNYKNSGRELHRTEGEESVRLYTADAAAALAFTSNERLARSPLPGKTLAATAGFAATVFETGDSSESADVPDGGVYMFCITGGGDAGGLSFSAGESLYFAAADTVSFLPESRAVFVV